MAKASTYASDGKPELTARQFPPASVLLKTPSKVATNIVFESWKLIAKSVIGAPDGPISVQFLPRSMLFKSRPAILSGGRVYMMSGFRGSKISVASGIVDLVQLLPPFPLVNEEPRLGTGAPA